MWTFTFWYVEGQYGEKHFVIHCEKLQKMKTKPSTVFLDTERWKNAFYPGESAIATAAAVGVLPHLWALLSSCRLMPAKSIQQSSNFKKEWQGEGKALSFHINYCYCMGFRDKHKTELGWKMETANATSYLISRIIATVHVSVEHCIPLIQPLSSQ